MTVKGSTLTLAFPAKSGKRALIEVEDADLAAAVDSLLRRSPRAALLWYPEGRRHPALSAQDVNEYVKELTGTAFTAKDFRTLRGTITAAHALAAAPAPKNAKDRKDAERLAVQAADVLGNGPAVARKSYIDPRIFERYRAGHVLASGVSSEQALRRLILDESA